MIDLKVVLSMALMLAASGVMAADEQKKKEKSPWSSQAELGYVMTSGNTDTSSVNAKLDVAHEVEKWKNAFHAESLSVETDEERTAARSLLTHQTDYKFTALDYAYGLLSYEKDRFSGFEYQAKAGLGYGRKILIHEAHTLNLEIGPGYRNFKVDNAASSDDEYLLRLAAKYLWKVSGTSKFTQDLLADLGEDQTEWKSITALQANINSALAMKLSHTVKYLDVVPVGNDNYDRETAVTLVYSF